VGSPEQLASAAAARAAGSPALGPRWRRAAGLAGHASGLVLRMALTGILAATLGLMAWAVMPLAAGWHGRVVLSGSMQPAIDPGDVVLAVPTDPSALRPGQAVVFRDPARPGRVDVHRIVRRNSDGTFITRGDANAQADSTPVPAANIIGLPRLRVPWVGLPQYWRQQRNYVALGLTVFVLTCSLWAVVTRPPNWRGTPNRRRTARSGAPTARHSA